MVAILQLDDLTRKAGKNLVLVLTRKLLTLCTEKGYGGVDGAGTGFMDRGAGERHVEGFESHRLLCYPCACEDALGLQLSCIRPACKQQSF